MWILDQFGQAELQLNDIFKPVSDIVYTPCKVLEREAGLDEATLVYMTSQILSFVLCLCCSHIHEPSARKYFSSTCGLFLGFYFNGASYFFILAHFNCVYLIAKLLPRQQAFYIGTVFSFSCLLLGHFYDYQLDFHGRHFTTHAMTTFCKSHMTLAAYNDAKKDSKQLTARERYHATYVQEFPSLIDWWHYHLLAATSFCGVMVEYQVYYDYIYGPDGKGQVRYRPFGNWWPAWKRFAEFWLCAIVFVLLSSKIDGWYMTKPEFIEEPFWYKCIYLNLSMQVKMFQMFTGFCAMEASFIAQGFSYKPKSDKEEETFNSVRQVDIVAFETSINPMYSTSTWNIGSHLWLKYHVMLRLIDRTQPRNKIQLIPYALTFFISAIWHGFYFGYVAFFTGLGLMDFAWKAIGNTKLVESFGQTKLGQKVGSLLSWLLCQLVISYFGMTFVYEDMEPGLKMWSAFNYIGHWGCLLVIIVSNILPQRKKGDKITPTGKE